MGLGQALLDAKNAALVADSFFSLRTKAHIMADPKFPPAPDWLPETLLVHGGSLRSSHGELS